MYPVHLWVTCVKVRWASALYIYIYIIKDSFNVESHTSGGRNNIASFVTRLISSDEAKYCAPSPRMSSQIRHTDIRTAYRHTYMRTSYIQTYVHHTDIQTYVHHTYIQIYTYYTDIQIYRYPNIFVHLSSSSRWRIGRWLKCVLMGRPPLTR